MASDCGRRRRAHAVELLEHVVAGSTARSASEWHRPADGLDGGIGRRSERSASGARTSGAHAGDDVDEHGTVGGPKRPARTRRRRRGDASGSASSSGQARAAPEAAARPSALSRRRPAGSWRPARGGARPASRASGPPTRRRAARRAASVRWRRSRADEHVGRRAASPARRRRRATRPRAPATARDRAATGGRRRRAASGAGPSAAAAQRRRPAAAACNPARRATTHAGDGGEHPLPTAWCATVSATRSASGPRRRLRRVAPVGAEQRTGDELVPVVGERDASCRAHEREVGPRADVERRGRARWTVSGTAPSTRPLDRHRHRCAGRGGEQRAPAPGASGARAS